MKKTDKIILGFYVFLVISFISGVLIVASSYDEIILPDITPRAIKILETTSTTDYSIEEVFLIFTNIEDYTKVLPKNIVSVEIINKTDSIVYAKEKISELEEADAIFVGGTGGDTKEIVELSEKKLKTGGRIVIGIILIETLYSVLQVMDTLQFKDVDITQVTISKSRKTTTGTMMLARNPVTIISATKA